MTVEHSFFKDMTEWFKNTFKIFSSVVTGVLGLFGIKK